MANTTNFNWETPDDTDLVKDGAAAIRTLGSAIDTSLVDLKGGTTGQVLSKATNTDMDFTWVAQDDSNAIQNALLTTTGDTIYASGASTPARLGIGTAGQVLTVNSGATAPEWKTPAGGGGKVLQVVQDLLDGLIQTTSTTYADTGLTVSITPSSATSKILIMAAMQGLAKTSGNSQTKIKIKLLRDSTTLQNTGERVAYTNADGTLDVGSHTIIYLDSPATTSALTYKIQYASGTSGQTVYINDYESSDNNRSSIIVMEIGA